MPDYSQWMKKTEKSAAKVVWLCGPERLLVEEVVQSMREAVDPDRQDTAVLYGSVLSPQKIWDAIFQASIQTSVKKLVIVRECDTLNNWTPLERVFSDIRQSQTHVVFVSDRNKPPSPCPDGLSAVKKRHCMVVCSPLKEEMLIQWTQNRGNLTQDSAEALVEYTGGELNAISDTCAKLKALDPDKVWEISDRSLDILTVKRPKYSFVEYLLQINKEKAHLALKLLDDREKVAVLSSLEQKLEFLQVLHKSQKRFKTLREIAISTRLDPVATKKYFQCARFYDSDSVRRRRLVLGLVYSSVHNHTVPVGALEALVCLW